VVGVVWDGSYSEWSWRRFKYVYYDYYITFNVVSGYMFRYYDDGTWRTVSGDEAQSISDNDTTVTFCNTTVKDVLSLRAQAVMNGDKAVVTQGLITTAQALYDQLVAARDSAATEYQQQHDDLEGLWDDYARKRDSYTAAQSAYDQARADYALVGGNANSMQAVFGNYSTRAAENYTGMVPAAATLKAATTDKHLKQDAFDAASLALDNARNVFKAAMTAFQSATASKESAQTRAGNLQDAVGAYQSIQADLACEQQTAALITGDAAELRQDIVDRLQKHEYLVNGVACTVSPAQASALVAGNTITFAGRTLDLNALLTTLSTDAKLKISANQTTTTARRNMTYNSSGYLNTYDELSFTGRDIVWNGATVALGSLTLAQKDSVFGSAPPSIALTGAGSLVVTRGESNEYDGEGKLVTSVQRVTETRKREDSPDTYTHAYTVTTDNIEYSGLGNISRYRKTTVDGQRTTVETTLDDIRYDVKGQQIESNIRATDTVQLVDGTVVYAKRRDIHTSNITYNALGQMTGYLRTSNDNGKVTVEQTLGDCAYSRQGRLVYSHVRSVETTVADLAAVLAELAAGRPSTGNITEIIISGAEYDSRDMATKMQRTVIDGDKRTDEEISMTYDTGRLKSSDSRVRESAVTTEGKLFYRSYRIQQNITAYYNNTELAVAQTRITTEGTKITAEATTGMTYDRAGRLTHSLTAMQEQYNGVNASPSTIETTIHDYDADNNISHQTKVTRESGKTTAETNWNAGTNTALYAGMTYVNGDLAWRRMRVTEKANATTAASPKRCTKRPACRPRRLRPTIPSASSCAT
jgi:hypothetical protein